MKSLKGVVLSTFSYAQTKEICVQYPTIFASPWYESWVWREKAMADFAISGEFFDLVPNLSPSQRYLQIKSYHVLTPDMAVRVHHDVDDYFIEGVYEAPAGYLLAKHLDDKEMKIFFANRLKPEQIKSLNKIGRVHMPSRTLDKETIDRLNAPRSYKPQPKPRIVKSFLSGLKKGRKDVKFLYMVLESGRVDWLDQILHRYFNLPPGFSIQKDIPYTPFWAEEFPLYDLPLYNGELSKIDSYYDDTVTTDYIEPDVGDLFCYMLNAYDTRVVDFFRSILRHKDRVSSHRLFLGVFAPKNPEETFAIYKRLGKSYGRRLSISTPEKALLEKTYVKTIVDNLGNIPLLQTLLPFVDKREVVRIMEVYAKGYPLTEKILEAYLEE
ncbi:Hypothetical protein BQ3484_98 [Cedratvirus A11]|uniref:Uncharacterized protein n=1 Tax=Cedratvirus A11 TaxID=1903266 RepID=A0A1M7XTY7_9VIRU|nr:Hypothetical protein BQ3484_98 [Cedratvirus A11]SHO33166.1 Hypothetical protein BQ3484_98 [Cedratvirus A11]